MKISDLVVGDTYKTNDLKEIFSNNSFMRGINICKQNSAIVLISKKAETRGREYEDTWVNETLMYTGEGQVGDQQMTRGNKAIRDAKANGDTLYLFVKDKHRVLTYFGIVDLANDFDLVGERDINGNERKVFKFPIRRRTFGYRVLTPEEKRQHLVNGTNPILLKTYYVVGAAIFNDKGQLLCCQRGHGDLRGKWEFPGGKIEQGESPEQALVREIKEELKIDIEVEEEIGATSHTYSDKIIDLRVFKCQYLAGKIDDDEHIAVEWHKKEDARSLNWADADQEVYEDVEDYFPVTLDDSPECYDYYEVKPSKNQDDSQQNGSFRKVQNYETSERKKKRHGQQAEDLLLRQEKDRLLQANKPKLSDMVHKVSDLSSDYGYDIESFDVSSNGEATPKHIEVKFVTKTSGYITFFVSAHELELFKSDPYYQVYCLYRVGNNYKYHIVNKNYWRDEYLTPLSYQVRIKICD